MGKVIRFPAERLDALPDTTSTRGHHVESCTAAEADALPLCHEFADLRPEFTGPVVALHSWCLGPHHVAMFSPQQARELAAKLLVIADKAELLEGA